MESIPSTYGSASSGGTTGSIINGLFSLGQNAFNYFTTRDQAQRDRQTQLDVARINASQEKLNFEKWKYEVSSAQPQREAQNNTQLLYILGAVGAMIIVALLLLRR